MPTYITVFHCFISQPSLKTQNKFARSAKMICSAIIICQFPGHVLESNGEPDTGPEAQSCHTASRLLLFTLHRLRQVIPPSRGISCFREALVGYRYAVRHFLMTLETWRRLDTDRVRKSLEMSYMDSYAMLLTARKMKELLQARKGRVEEGLGESVAPIKTHTYIQSITMYSC